MSKTHIIIGTSAAGIGVLSKLRTLDAQSTIICISDEAELPYNKCNLADYLGKIKEQSAVYTRDNDFFKKNNINLMLGRRVAQIDRSQRRIILDSGESLTYDMLFLGLGSGVVKPPFACSFNRTSFLLNDQSIDHKKLGIFVFHTLNDTHAIMDWIKQVKPATAVIVGAGLSGLESADALVAYGIDVTVVEMNDQVLSRQVDKTGSELIERYMHSKNVKFLKQEKVVEIQGTDRVKELRLASGTVLPADMVVVATGLKPRTALALEAGLECNNGYLTTNDFLQTSDSYIWAGGDCIEVKDQITGMSMPSCTWPDAMLQGAMAAHSMAGAPKSYPGATIVSSSTFFGIQFVTCGPVAQEASCRVKQSDDFYHKLLVDQNYLKGFLLVGTVHDAPKLKRILLTKQPVSQDFF